MNFSICIADYVLEISVLHYSPAIPAKTWGTPESCYEAEDAVLEYEIQLAYFSDDFGNYVCSESETAFIEAEYDEDIREALMKEIDKYTEALNDAYEGQRESDWEY